MPVAFWVWVVAVFVGLAAVGAAWAYLYDRWHYNLARSCAARAAASERDRDGLVAQAVAHLRALHASGYFDAPSAVAGLKRDGYFDGIRQHPAFVDFLARLEAGALKKGPSRPAEEPAPVPAGSQAAGGYRAVALFGCGAAVGFVLGVLASVAFLIATCS